MDEDAYSTWMQQNTSSEGIVGMLLVGAIMAVSILSAVGAMLSFLFTMTFFRVPEDHRKMKLGAIWLIMIPLFGVAWVYFTVWRLAKSFQAYFDGQDPDSADYVTIESDFGMKRGLWMTIAAVIVHASVVLALSQNPYVLGIGLGVTALVAIVFTTMYFWQVYKVRNLIPDPESETLPESYL